MSLTQRQKDLWMEVDRILWEEWDPIGVNDYGPNDEYQSYIPSIIKLLINGEPAKIIALRLDQHTEVNMGLPPNHKHNLKVADLLIEVRDQMDKKYGL